jgi:hypothetical protein
MQSFKQHKRQPINLPNLILFGQFAAVKKNTNKKKHATVRVSKVTTQPTLAKIVKFASSTSAGECQHAK